jgi:hypothetical protein
MVMVLSAIALSIGPCVLAAQANAGAATSTMWGIDTTSVVGSSFISQVETASNPYTYGTPQFVGRYFVWGGGTTLSASEASWLLGNVGPILMLDDPAGTVLTDADGTTDATQAIAAASALGVPGGTALFRDVEEGDSVTAGYIENYVQTIDNQGTYVPGFYEDPSGGVFNAEFCAAESSVPEVANAPLYSSEPEELSYTFAQSQAPAFAPAQPSCSNTTVGWQYLEAGVLNPPGELNVDVDEYQSQYLSYLWNDNAGTGVTYSAPAVLSPNSVPSVFFEGPGHSLVNDWYVPGQTPNPWDSETIAGTAGTVYSQPSVIANPNTRPSVFYEGPNGTLVNTWNYGPDEWDTASHAYTLDSMPSAYLQTNGLTSVFFQGPGNVLDYAYDTANGWVLHTEPGTVDSQPAVLVNSNGLASVFFEGPNHQLNNTWEVTSTTWSTNDDESATNAVYSKPTPIFQSNGDPSCFYLGPSSSLGYAYWVSAGTWDNRSVPGTVDGTPTAVQLGNGDPSAFFESTGSTLVNTQETAPGTWITTTRPGNVQSDEAVITQADGTPSVFYEGPQNTWENTWYDSSNMTWHNASHTS